MTEDDPFAVKPAEPETAADKPSETETAPVADPLADRDVVAASTDTGTHDTEHDKGLSDQDARVPGDAAPLPGATATVADEKEPLGSLPDTATATETLPVLNTDVSDKTDNAPTLGDAVVPTKPGGADLEDIDEDATKDVLSTAPRRAHEGLVNQLDLKVSELKHFVSTLEGEIDGELGEFLDFIRARL